MRDGAPGRRGRSGQHVQELRVLVRAPSRVRAPVRRVQKASGGQAIVSQGE